MPMINERMKAGQTAEAAQEGSQRLMRSLSYRRLFQMTRKANIYHSPPPPFVRLLLHEIYTGVLMICC